MFSHSMDACIRLRQKYMHIHELGASLLEIRPNQATSARLLNLGTGIVNGKGLRILL